MQPRFLDLDRVLRTHRSLIEHYGGVEGVRDIGAPAIRYCDATGIL